MSELIERQAALDALARIAREKFNLSDEYNHYLAGLMDGELAIKNLPTVQPEQHEGHWILYDKRFPWRFHYKCSECGNYLDFSGVNGGRGEANFCPNCGAKMKGEQDGH